MRQLSRRDFLLLTGSCLAGWGALMQAARENQRQPPSRPVLEAEQPAWWPAPGPLSASPQTYRAYVGGTILEVKPGELTVGNPLDGAQILVLAPHTEYEENLWVKDLPIEPGERVFAAVSPAGAGRFRVDKLYVNHEFLIGQVLSVEGGPQAPFTLTMTDRYDERRPASETPHHVLIDPRTRRAQIPKLGPGTIVSPIQMRDLGSEPLLVEPGNSMQVIGRVKDGTLMAVTVLTL